MYCKCKNVAISSYQKLSFHFRGVQARLFSNADDHFSDPGAPRVALSKDHKTILMYHPDEPIEYEKTIPIPRDDSRYNYECVEDKISERLHEMDVATRPIENPSIRHLYPMFDRDVVPTAMELAGMFFTSKHYWLRPRHPVSRLERFRTPW